MSRAGFVGLLALAFPVMGGLGALWLMGAPASFLMVNAGTLVVGLALIAFLPQIDATKTRRFAIVALLVLLALPLLTGPYVNGIARWLPLGPFTLHAGMLAIPMLAALTARDEDYSAPILLAGILAAAFQPDAASGLALTFAAMGLYNAKRDWKDGVVAGTGFFATLVMWVRGALPAQPFVERVLVDVAVVQPLAALALLACLVASFLLILHALPAPMAQRHTLAGTLFGFSIAAVLSNYPSALIGYGAAPILGFAFALSQIERAESKAPPVAE
ncbi:hypothetical protein Q9K02_10765 [Qipengyuania sp. G39]|uniref:Cell wall polymerase n=1 Tax=Qipengyuania profundimaris TaxID=3067652 RepID=A0ABT9HR42_9SPHN|nr:hypothetical protein [Qipengyuania sp. G39]MDP4575619.1 hypothetical protein [Qipengyuania sp. G39]